MLDIKYLDWLLSLDGALSLNGSLFCFLLIAFVLLVIRWLLFLRFFYLPLFSLREAHEVVHGVPNESAPNIILFWLLCIVIDPPIEELIYRGPILFYIMKGEIALTVAIVFLSAIVFALNHRFNRTTYADKTRVTCEWPAIWNIFIGGVLYGFLTMISVSLWSSIFLHILWNASTIVVPWFFGDDHLTGLAKAMQR